MRATPLAQLTEHPGWLLVTVGDSEQGQVAEGACLQLMHTQVQSRCGQCVQAGEVK